MKKEQILASVRRKSSAILKKDLLKEESQEKREIIEAVLRQRGCLKEDLGEGLNTPTPSKEQLEKLDEVITRVCECDDDKLKSSVGEILETVQEYSELSLLQVETILTLSKKLKPPKPQQPVLQKTLPKESIVSQTTKKSSQSLTEEQSNFLQQKLSELTSGSQTKRETIISLMEFGLTKQQIDKNVDDKILHWSTVYSIYRENGK